MTLQCLCYNCEGDACPRSRFEQFTRRWVPHTLSDPQKMTRVEASDELLQILSDLEADSSDEITIDNESWFHYLSESSVMFSKSPGDLIPRTRKEIGVKQTVFPIFFTNRKLLIAKYLPKGQKYNRDYFIAYILLELEREKKRYKPGKQGRTFCANMGHSKSHDGGKIQDKVDRKGLTFV
jgi:hypothetical protein